jgi:hypothetical protein
MILANSFVLLLSAEKKIHQSQHKSNTELRRSCDKHMILQCKPSYWPYLSNIETNQLNQMKYTFIMQTFHINKFLNGKQDSLVINKLKFLESSVIQ